MSEKQTHVMVDLETWSTSPNAHVISIGAVKFESTVPVSLAPQQKRFDQDGNPLPPLMDTFHVGIEPESLTPYKFDIDPATVNWWMGAERDAARAAWQQLEKFDVGTVLMAFIKWLDPASPTSLCIWGNGATFDNVILRNLITKVLGADVVPWSFRNDRCYRTVLSEWQNRTGLLIPVEDFGVAHSALADALYQARRLQLIYEHLGWTL